MASLTTGTGLVTTARDLAAKAHEGQTYGDKPYILHCAEVVRLLQEHGVSDPEILAAAWLHDAMEDTTLTRGDVETVCGEEVGRLVWACTGVGKNRKERNAEIYLRVAFVERAAIIKVADRLANVQACVQSGDSRLRIYRKEWPLFRSIVVQTVNTLGQAPSLLRELTRLMENPRSRVYG